MDINDNIIKYFTDHNLSVDNFMKFLYDLSGACHGETVITESDAVDIIRDIISHKNDAEISMLAILAKIGVDSLMTNLIKKKSKIVPIN
jgi:hypothetical protein